MEGESFNGNFTTEGVAMLQERLREKLRELMEDYTDESLVDYVLVLLRNGRGKDDAIKELHVFLGDESSSFVSWLWEHLSLNSHLYVKEEAPTLSSIVDPANDSARKRDLSRKSSTDGSLDKMEVDGASRKEVRRDRHKRGQQEMFPLRSVITHILHGEERNKQSSSSLKQFDSSKDRDVKKRPRVEDEQQPQKRGSPFINVSRRLLQSAVRDAVKPVPQVQRTDSSSEQTSKRLRSVVLTSPKEKNPDAMVDSRPQRKRSTLNASASLIAFKAAAEAAESTSKPRNSRSVFDRLATRSSDSRKGSVEREYVEINQFEASKNCALEKVDSIDELDEQKELKYQSTLAVDSSEDDVVKQMSPEQDLTNVVSDEITNLSVNAETCKEEHSANETSNAINKMVAPSCEKENTSTLVMPMPVVEEFCTTDLKEDDADAKKESQKTSSVQAPASYATSHPLDDVDSRTVFVSNVNFAATKDALSRHFNKFGAVLKVVLINDPTTGQPTGSACVEFLNKDSAELALSVNGTSFMSRIVKVVKRNSHEASQFLGWSNRGGRVSSSFGMYPRAVAFRGRPPIKPGARSLQWKRGTSTIAQPPVASTNTDAN